ncbi:MAG: helix-turn-helix transcriptional regulator [Rhodoglobus sp.]
MPPPHQAPRIAPEERLFNLVLALLASETGLTKTDIMSTVQGYRHKFTHTGDNRNLERQFERDKDDIRDLGIPLDTVDSPGSPGDNHSLRYRIPRDAYKLPSDIRFSSEEIALLALAAMVWREGSLSSESRRAILKLRSLGVAATEPVLGYAPRMRVREAAFDSLTVALEKHRVVSFRYLKPGQHEATVRTVAPFALIQHQARWHLFAAEVESGATKTFLLRRIISPVTAVGATFVAPPAGQADIALAQLEDRWNSHTATVEVVEGTDAATQLSTRRGTVAEEPGILLVHYSDVDIIADELAGYGPEVLVMSPPELRAAVQTRLERTVSDHG